MSLTHVDPHVSEIVMVWIQSGDLLMVWIQISQKEYLGSVWLRSQVERSRSIPDSMNGAALFCVW